MSTEIPVDEAMDASAASSLSPSGGLASGGGVKVVDEWLIRHGDAMHAYATRMLGQRGEVEDVLQESLFAAWKNHRTFDGRSAERTWLIAIVKHKAIDAIRKKERRRPETNLDEVVPLDEFFNKRGRWKQPVPDWGMSASDFSDPSSAMEHAELIDALRGCVGDLPPTLNRTFVLREMQQQDSEAVCEDLKISPSNLWARLHRARLAVRACIERMGLAPSS